MLTRARLTILTALAASVAVAAPLSAIFYQPDIQNVPIERLLPNLERLAAQKPDDVYVRLNLARTHAMAFALRSESVPVAGGLEESGAWLGGSGDPAARRVPLPVATTDPARLAAANAHLVKAIHWYGEAVRVAKDPELAAVAKLGQAWAVEMSGDKPRAIDLYRTLIASQAEADQRRTGLAPSGLPVSAEAIGYLIPLLDPVRDRAEIERLTAQRTRLAALPRAITPVAIPLRAGMTAWDVVDHDARVRFDADGFGLVRNWTWISRDAGWLVYEQRGAPITSALQLFGNVTFWLFWENGYQPMRALDDDGDGRLAGRELINLFVWRDANQNGGSDRREILPLAAWGIVSLSYTHEIEEDGVVAAIAPHGVTFRDGTTRPTFDVLLHRVLPAGQPHSGEDAPYKIVFGPANGRTAGIEPQLRR
jgi:hypothetical protein